MDDLESYQELISIEESFLEFVPPKHRIKSAECLIDRCCEKGCVMNVTRKDILLARKTYVQFASSISETSKHTIRNMFIRRLKSIVGEQIQFNVSSKLCITMIARSFGCSVYQLLNEPEIAARTFARPLYSKTISKVGEALAILTEIAEPNPVSGLLVPPSLSNKVLSSQVGVKVNLSLVRKVVGINARRRKCDSLMRCGICAGLKHRIANSYARKRREALSLLRTHYRIISMERSVIECLATFSRNETKSVLLLKMDSMSNQHSRLPILYDRGKSIGDSDLVALHLSTVQVATKGSHKFTNYDYIDYQTKYKNGSSYYVSLILNTLSRLSALPDHLLLNLDGCAANKGDILLGGLSWIMLKTPVLNRITLLYQNVGHTHNSCDAHFGVLSTKLSESECRDPNELMDLLRSFPSVADTLTNHSIFDFAVLDPFIRKYKYRSTNNQIILYKTNEGKIEWSSASYITADTLFEDTNERKSYPFFKDDVDVTTLVPTFVKADSESRSRSVCENLFEKAGNLLSEENKTSYLNHCEEKGKYNDCTEDDFIHVLHREYSLQSSLEHQKLFQKQSKRFVDGKGYRKMPKELKNADKTFNNIVKRSSQSIMTPLLVHCYNHLVNVELTKHTCQACKYQFLMVAEDFDYFIKLLDVHTIDIRIEPDAINTFRTAFANLSEEWRENIECLNISFDGHIDDNLNEFLRSFTYLETLRIQHNSNKAINVEWIIGGLRRLENLDLHYPEELGCGYFVGPQFLNFITQGGKYSNYALPRHIVIHGCVTEKDMAKPIMFAYSRVGDYHPATIGFYYFFYDYQSDMSQRCIVQAQSNTRCVKLQREAERDPHELRNQLIMAHVPQVQYGSVICYY